MSLEKLKIAAAATFALGAAACERQENTSAATPPQEYSAAWYAQNYESVEDQWIAACADWTVRITLAHNRADELRSSGINEAEGDPIYDRLVDQAVAAATHRDRLQEAHPEYDPEHCFQASSDALRITGLE